MGIDWESGMGMSIQVSEQIILHLAARTSTAKMRGGQPRMTTQDIGRRQGATAL